MKDNKPYIVVAQTLPHDRGDIKKSVSGKNIVYFTGDPRDAFLHVLSNPVDILVTSHWFYEIDLISDKPFETLIRVNDITQLVKPYFYKRTQNDTMENIEDWAFTGKKLSQQVKLMRKNVISIRYSSTPLNFKDKNSFSGEVIKSKNHSRLLDILNSENLYEIIRKKDWKLLKSTFPQIIPYNGFKESTSFLEFVAEEAFNSLFSFFGFNTSS